MPSPFPGMDPYLEDRDLWRWKLPASRQVSAAIASYPFDFEVWNHLAGGLEGEGSFSFCLS